MIEWTLKKFLGTKHEREIKKLQPQVAAIAALESKMKALDDAALKGKTGEFRQKIAQGASLDDLLIPAFAVCREASRRALGMRHFDVQLIGGMVLHEGKIAEMKTGEGKTLVATLACYLNALSGKGVHVVTVNDYLATRDAEWMGQLYGFLGLSTGVVVHSQGDGDKKRAYRADITYGQNNEFGFDYLRDNMKFSIYDYAQRELNFAIVDEVDSILIDEARTPLIISGPGETASEKYRRVSEMIPRLRKDQHYTVDEKNHSVTLTEEGMEAGQTLLHQRGLTEVENLYDPVNLETLHILQQSLRAHTLYKRDQHYMVSPDGQVMIIDEFTGRVLPGRRWSDGLHQAVEAKEQVSIQDENLTLASISFQNLFRLYNKLAGMTGTADTEAAEFHKIYKLDVVVVPTNKPVVRDDAEDIVYKSEKEKFRAVAEDISDAHKRGQPVLVGTTSVEKSDALSRMLTRNHVPHEVLNAKQHEREAYVVAQAGRRGAVTVATNMAGRGTDIVLGGNAEMLAKLEVLAEADPALTANPSALQDEIERRANHLRIQSEEEKKHVLEAGGLHILGTERHESRRIDNQLRGRSGRQGDPGSSRFYLSLEDDLMRIFAGDRLQTLMDRIGMEEDVPIEHRWVTRAVENAQRKVEERNFDIRKHLLEYDDVMNQQRKSIYALRKQVLEGTYRQVVPEGADRKETDRKEVKPLVEKADPTVSAKVEPKVDDLLRHYAEQVHSAADEGTGSNFLEASFPPAAVARVEQEVYLFFGCPVELVGKADTAGGIRTILMEAVPLSLTEQRERLLDLVDELCGEIVDRTCPPGKDPEDWNVDQLKASYKEQFGLAASGVEKLSTHEDMVVKLYQDAEAVLLRKEEDFGTESYLRLFRNFFLQEIDRQWVEHLQTMEHLRDGIGLRGYGQRDPKKEYKREGYNLFVQMMTNVKGAVISHMSHVERLAEEDVTRLERKRREQIEAQQRRIQMNHIRGDDDESDGDAKTPAANRRARRRAGVEAAPKQAVTIKRDKPKIGRNDPCWCGSGKKYKQCHLREDEVSARSA